MSLSDQSRGKHGVNWRCGTRLLCLVRPQMVGFYHVFQLLFGPDIWRGNSSVIRLGLNSEGNVQLCCHQTPTSSLLGPDTITLETWTEELPATLPSLSICSMQWAPCAWVYQWFPLNPWKEPTAQQFLWKKVRDLQQRANSCGQEGFVTRTPGGFTYLCKEGGDRRMRWFSTKCGWTDGRGAYTCSWKSPMDGLAGLLCCAPRPWSPAADGPVPGCAHCHQAGCSKMSWAPQLQSI